METKFQTSFIPKKPLVPVGGATAPHKHHSTSLFMTIGVFVFLASLVAAGAAYAWKGVLTSSQEKYKKDLADREQQFQVSRIEDLKRTNVRIDLASKLLSEHLAVSQIFDIVSRFTVSDVRFISLSLGSSATNPADGLRIEMKGYGSNLAAVAFQSDVLGQLERYGLRKIVKNPILSDTTTDSNGTEAFGFSAVIDPSAMSYVSSVRGESTASSSPNTNP
ncbi:MAG: hypothetical protein V4481_05585 [Patescibacteria group bacterium]